MIETKLVKPHDRIRSNLNQKTNFIAIGVKERYHTEVEMKSAKDFQFICNVIRYRNIISAIKKGIIDIHVEFFASLQG